MRQTNLETGFTRKIKLEQDTPWKQLLDEPSDARVQWCYRDDRGQYSPYTPRDSAAIESSFSSGQKSQ